MNFRLVLAAAMACSLFSCAPAPAYAEEATEPFKLSDLTIGVHAYTYHFDKSQNYNNYNPGLYLEYQGWIAGAYYNSERAPSAYAGYTFKAVFGSWIDVTVGAVTGYERAAVLPLVVPSIKVWDHVRFSLLLPPEKTGWGLHVSFEF